MESSRVAIPEPEELLDEELELELLLEELELDDELLDELLEELELDELLLDELLEELELDELELEEELLDELLDDELELLDDDPPVEVPPQAASVMVTRLAPIICAILV